jgi:Bax protein
MYRYSHPAEQPVSRSAAAGTLTAPQADNQPSSVKAITMVKQPRKPESNTTRVDTSAAEKKQAFIQELLPHIEKENERLLKLRLQVVEMFRQLENDESGPAGQLQRLAKQYRVKGDVLSSASARDDLLSKVDIIPSSLALAQAASESAWGQSRFATEANNLFGIWTYDESKGLKPRNREQGKTHLVRVFDDIGDSVRYYMHTLNSHPAYDELRIIRQQLRQSGQEISGHELAAGLERYSAKGQAYIDLIRSLIRQNEWARLDTGDQPA